MGGLKQDLNALLDIGEVIVTFLGQHHPPASAAKQLDAEDAFQLSDLMADGRSADMQFFGCILKALMAGCGFKGA
ncbi:MAG: hypothetical protein OIF56_08560 [Cohaesibacter sp.]|nr:hypothetical protein [Cohaesibacter sp.]